MQVQFDEANGDMNLEPSVTLKFDVLFFFFFDSCGVFGPAYAHHDYSPRSTGHPASPGAGKASRG